MKFKDFAFENAYLKVLREQADANADVDDAVNDAANDEDAEKLSVITFKTSDENIINLFKNGFKVASFIVDDANEDAEPVEVAFNELVDVDVIDADECDETCPECGKNPCKCNDADNTIEEDDDGGDVSCGDLNCGDPNCGDPNCGDPECGDEKCGDEKCKKHVYRFRR